jgi:ketosteroid isomerase-like protein
LYKKIFVLSCLRGLPSLMIGDAAAERRRTMKSFLAAVLTLSVVSSGRVVAQAGSAGMEKKILDLEKQRITAMVKKDIAALDALLADDMSYTHSGGTTDTKASFIKLIKERGRYLGVDYSNTQVIASGANSVIVRGIAQIRLENTPPYPVIFVDVWVLRDGAWKMVAWQATRVPRDRATQ